MTAGEVCTRAVIIVRPEETIVEAARRMREYHVGDLVVAQERSGMRFPVGILTDRDIVVSVVARDIQHLDKLTVGDVIGAELITARDDESLHEVMDRMCAHGIRRIPVVNRSGALEGIISLDDLLELLGEHLNRLSTLIRCEQRREREERP
jgi:CBS domain-containing protein